jgi:hypothetical protein
MEQTPIGEYLTNLATINIVIVDASPQIEQTPIEGLKSEASA